ncbi:phospholipase A [Herbaspirillum rhizosphaerae]|uniref:phospholipase A n=1 Tax=Herbaspirillum rhizosphaerae TaxID=346179 RepID=UPI003084275F
MPSKLRTLQRALFAAGALTLTHGAVAGISVLQPPKVIDGNKPFVLTLMVSEDEHASQAYALPDDLVIAASADMTPPVQVHLRRDGAGPGQFTLQRGEFRKVTYSAELPRYLRGVIRIETVGVDASPVLVAVVRAKPGQEQVADASVAAAATSVEGGAATPSASAITPGASSSPIGIAPAAADLINTPRLSFNEPMYFAAGNSGGNRNAKFQLSFKFRIFQPDDMRSRGLIDNLYFGYTQFSLWDLQSPSSPFRDTNYRPSLYYYLPDVGIHNSVLSRVSIASGLEHESNGRDGPQSRGLNIFFVQPTLTFGNLNDYQFRISPKIYTYLGPLSDNPDIGQYRGHTDLKLAFGKPDGVEFSTTLRKGTRSNTGSADSMLSYPLARLIPGTAGYLMASYFYGYGESLLTYNQKSTPQFRIGYSLSR